MNELIAENLCRSFNDLTVLNNFSFSLKEGEILCLMGPSGAGKTTLLRIVTGLETADSGKLCINDTELALNGKRKNSTNIGMVFQNFNLFNNLTILDNCTLALTYHKLCSMEQANQKALQLLAQLGIEDKKDNYPSSLSGGQKQRAAIARAILPDPQFLCFDEPTSALDRKSIEDVETIIKDLASRGIGILIVTHDEAFAKRIASRRITMA